MDMQFKSLFLLLFLPSFLIAQHAPSTTADLHWEYLVFEDVPSKEQTRILAKNNIQLYQYQQDLTWLASFPANTENRIFKEAGVIRTFSPGTQQKIAPEIYFNQVPNYAQSANGVKTHITIAAVKEYDLFQSALERLGIHVTSIFEPLGILKAEGTPQSLVQAAQLPYVIYIELIDPPAELEIEDEMASSRAPYMNGYYNLDGINGEGIDIAVNEGGTVNPAFDPDFKNRLNRTQESGNTSGHKTNVGWRMASAGNIDPVFRGQAWGATLHSGGINFTNAALGGINIVNNSFGYGCISGNATYNSGAALNDYLVRTYPTFMITYSCGNIGGSSCASYGAGPGWGSITGLVKSAKNIFAVGALNTNDQLTGFSSRGPAKDGRILPDITAAGPGGTSYASPNLGGVNALLTHAYREENNNQWPASGLIKGIILNTADDLENPGPDFRTGFGRINAKRGQEVIVNGQFINDNITNNTTKTHSISVPTGVQQVKISLYWTDREATAGITGKTLVNNLDLRVQAPNSSAWTLPWVLNTFPHNDSLILNAIHGIDTLNNVELVTFDNPAAGTYTVEVDGDLVPFGPQNYHVIYSFVYDSVAVIFPKGGEGLVPGEQRRIRWDAADAGGQFNIELSTDSGLTWQSIAAGVANDTRHYVWSIPNTISGLCQVKISNANQSSTSDLFTIAEPPVNLELVWRCADSAMFAWDSVPGALAYRVYRLGNKFMDTATTSTTNYTMLYNLSSTESEWISVQTILPDRYRLRHGRPLSSAASRAHWWSLQAAYR